MFGELEECWVGWWVDGMLDGLVECWMDWWDAG